MQEVGGGDASGRLAAGPVRAGAGGGAGSRLLRHRQQGTLATSGMYTVKKANYFPIHSRDVSNRTLPGREYSTVDTYFMA
jgi:hypothetical protein